MIREPGSGSREVLLDALAAKRFSFARVIEISNAEAIFHAVTAGLGISWASELAVAAHEVGAIEQLDVKDFRVMRTMSHIRRRDLAPTPAMLAFLEIVEDAQTLEFSPAPASRA